MTLTPEQSSAITRHLAEKVCGAKHEEDIPGRWWWIFPSGAGVATFHPLTDPRDTALVMEAWNKRKYASFMLSASASIYRCVVSDSQLLASVEHAERIESWTEAVCLAIFRASGGSGI